MKKIKFLNLFLLISLTWCSQYASAADKPQTPVTHLPEPCLKFLIVGDWGEDGAEGQKAVAREMAKVAAKNNIGFIISMGDHFNHDKVFSVDDPLWQTNFEQVYSAPSLQVPWYAILGNHCYIKCKYEDQYNKGIFH